MSLTKDTHIKGKERAVARIEQWVYDVTGSGIDRLISEFPGSMRHFDFHFESQKMVSKWLAEKRHLMTLRNVKLINVVRGHQRFRRHVVTPESSVFSTYHKISSSDECMRTSSASASGQQRTSHSEVSLMGNRGSRARNSRRSLPHITGSRQNVEPIIHSLEYDDARSKRGAVKSANHSRTGDTSPSLGAEGMSDSNEKLTMSRSMTLNMLPRNAKSRQRSRRDSFSSETGSIRAAIEFRKSPETGSPSESPEAEAPQLDYTYQGNAPRLVRFLKKILIIVTLFKCTSRQLRCKYYVERKLYEIKGEDGEALIFNPYQFSRFSGSLSSDARKALEKRPGTRSPHEINTIMDVINRLPAFDTYSMGLKKGLADRFVCDYLQAGRVVSKQGHAGVCSYFVVSGILCSYFSETDPKTGRQFVTYLPDMMTGTTFGGVALVREMKRTITVICKSDCELLVLNRDDLNEATRLVLQQEWDNKYNFWRGLPEFRTWEDEDCRTLSDHSKICHYKHNEVIASAETGGSNLIQFILVGRCRVIKRMPTIRPKHLPALHADMLRPAHMCYEQEYRSLPVASNNVMITYLKSGDNIALGKGMENIYIVASGKVSCIYLKAAQFKYFARRKNLIGLSKGNLQLMPNDKTILCNLIVSKTWSEYKKRIVEEIIKRRNINNRARLEDVPISIRADPTIV